MKKTIITLVLGVVLGTISSVLASTMLASNIAYTPKDKTWGVNNVEAAIDSLKISKTSDNYSTEEHVVGTWTDGKPVYEIVKSISFDSNGNASTGFHTDTYNFIRMDVLADGIVYSSPPYIYAPDNNHVFISCSSLKSKTAVAVFEYTKTTD